MDIIILNRRWYCLPHTYNYLAHKGNTQGLRSYHWGRYNVVSDDHIQDNLKAHEVHLKRHCTRHNVVDPDVTNRHFCVICVGDIKSLLQVYLPRQDFHGAIVTLICQFMDSNFIEQSIYNKCNGQVSTLPFHSCK